MANPSHDKGNASEHADFSDEAIRHRFFRDLIESERLAVFKAFGVYPPGCTDRLDHSIERRLLNRILRRATLPSPSTAPDATHPAFQAAMKAAGHRFDRWDNGTYKGMTEYRWEGWVAALASRPAEVDDEGLPPLPAPLPLDDHEARYSAEQYRQGQRDAVAADRARREVDGKIPRESNDALIKLAKYWKLDGDWMTCRGCRRSLIASRDGEELNHGDGCKFWDQHHPWAQLRELIARRPPAENTP